MYASASAYRTPGRSRRSQSDPGHPPYVTPPYTVQWPAPMRQTADPMGSMVAHVNGGTPYQRSPSRNSSVERIPGDPFVPHPGSLLAQHQMSNSPGGTTSTSTPVSPSPRSPSPQRSAAGHPRSASRQGSVRAPQGQGPLIKDVPQPPRTAFNVPSAITAPHPHPVAWGQGQPGFPVPVPVSSQISPTSASFHMAGLQGSQYTIYQPPPASPTNPVQHYPAHHHPSTTHHVTHPPRSRSRPPSAASHRYASSITPSVYGHRAHDNSSATLNASRTSLNGGSLRANHHPHARDATASASAGSPHHLHHHHHSSSGPGMAPVPAGSPQRSRSHRVPPPSTTHHTHRLEKTPPSTPLAQTPTPPATGMAPANEVRRAVHRPALPDNYDGQQTRYVRMLLALDGISPVFNVLSSFFTWILLAGFVLLPGTFASWKDEPAGSAQSDILSVVNDATNLFVIAFVCTGVGVCGMCWLWWKWYRNYIWLTNRIFLPGFLNSAAGVISTLSSIYGVQAGDFGPSQQATIIVTVTLTIVFGILVATYEFWLTRNLRLEHDEAVGVEAAGRHGEGVLAEKRDGRD